MYYHVYCPMGKYQGTWKLSPAQAEGLRAEGYRLVCVS